MQADNSQYVKALDQATSKLTKFQKDQESLFDKIGDKLRDIAGDLVAAFTVDKIIEFSVGAIEAQASLAKLSQELGVSVEKLSEMNLAFAAGGLSTEETTVAMKKLAISISDAAGSATSKAGVAFRLLGISVRDAAGNMKSVDAILREISDAYARSADGSNKVAINNALMGKTALAMIPELNQGGAALDVLAKAARDSGYALSTEAAEAADKLEKKLNLLKAEAVGGLQNAIAKELVPVLLSLADSLSGASDHAASFAVIGQGIAEVFKIVATIGLEVAREFESLGSAVGGAAAAVAAAVRGDLHGAWQILNDQHADALAIDTKYAAAQASLYKHQSDTEIAYAELTGAGLREAKKKQLDELGSMKGQEDTDTALKKLEQYTQGLQAQAATFGLGEAALVKYKLTIGDLSKDVEAAGAQGQRLAAEAIAAAAHLQSAKDTASSDKMVKGLQDQINKYNQSDAAAYKYLITTGELGDMFTRMGAKGAEAQAKLMALNATITDNKDRDAVQALNDEIAKTAGLLADAGTAAFDLKNKGLTKNLQEANGGAGDAAGLATLATRRAQIDAEDKFAEQVAKSTAVQQQMADTEAQINLQRANGMITDLAALKQLDEAHNTEIGALGQIYDAEKKIAADSRIPKLTADTQAFATQITNLKTQTDILEKSVRDNLEQSFANNFSDLITGAKTFKDALRGFLQDIEKMFADLIAKNLAEQLFGVGGAAGGSASWITSLLGVFGGGGGSVASTGAAASGLSSGGYDALIGSIGGFAGGGTIPAGSFGTVGESGPELAYAGSSDLHIQPMGSGGAASINYSPVIQIDARSDRAQVQAETAAAVRKGNVEMVNLLRRYNPALRT